MKVVIDIEADGLEDPKNIWLIVCKDIDTGKVEKFNHVCKNQYEKARFLSYAEGVSLWIGHHILGYDGPVIHSLLDGSVDINPTNSIDTLIISKLVDYSREAGHSIEAYGEEFGVEKGQFYKFTDPELHNSNSILFKQLEVYCVRDVDIAEQVYRKYLGIISDPSWHAAIACEQRFQIVCNDLHTNGFQFNSARATSLLEKVTGELNELDTKIAEAFRPRSVLIREYTPKETKHGTISRTSIPRNIHDLSAYSVGASFCTFVWKEFNASSHKQVIEVLHTAGWNPTDKTQSHIDFERELQRSSRQGRSNSEDNSILSKEDVAARRDHLGKYGWKVNEANLQTLPAKAPEPARLLAKRILLESRRRTLTEWLGLCNPSDGRIHGRFYGIGAWTHRMAHQKPNTANIPNEYDTSGKRKLLGKELRSLWCSPKKRLLVGVDAEGIQLRIFAHYIDDPEFTKALVEGKKDDKTDPHSLNQRVLGSVCKSRQAAKRFVYALLLGAGLGKLSEVLECSSEETRQALDRLMARYEGFKRLKETLIPTDAKRGYFIGLDGRKVKLYGETVGERRHLCMSGYLQNGEAVVMKRATLKWHDLLKKEDAILVNFVHDEYIVECPNNVDTAIKIAKMMADSIKDTGEELGLKCPLAGSYWNEDKKDYTIGTSWYETH